MMENDHKNIDKLFRENLSSREVPPNDSDWADIEKSLNTGNRMGGNSFGWILGSLIVLISAGALFFLTRSSSHPISSETSSVSSNSSSSQNDHTTNSLNSSVVSDSVLYVHSPSSTERNNASETKQHTTSEGMSASASGSSSGSTTNFSSKTKESTSSQSSGSTSTSIASSSHNTKHTPKSTKTSGKSSSRARQTESKKSAGSLQEESVGEAKTTLQEESAVSDFVALNETENKTNKSDHSSYRNFQPDAESTIANKQFPFGPAYQIPLMKTLQKRLMPFSEDEEKLSSTIGISSENALILSNWSVGISLFGGIVNSSIEDKSYLLSKRNNEERRTFHWGMLLDAGYKKGRSQFGFGLGYEKTGENIQYADEIIRPFTYQTTEMQIYEFNGTLLDSVLQDTTWIITSIDTSFTDTTYIVVQNTKDSLYHDKEITSKNGTTTIQQIVIPFSYRYDLFHFSESAELFVSGSMQLDYALKRRASYLDEDTRMLKDIRNFTTYRSINTSAALGIGLRMHHSKRLMTVVEFYGRTNLFSWNTDFGHRYSSFGLRLGVGYNF